MKVINYFIILLVSLSIFGCSKITEPVKKVSLGNRIIDYQADEQVDKLIVPPDLTDPSFTGEFTKTISIESNEPILPTLNNVEVKRDNYRRWLLLELPSDQVWSISKEFFRSYGFKIETENQKIGIFETNYLEIETDVPEKSLGVIRAALSKALKTQYGLPIADKYRVRIEPTENSNQSEVYLTLSSIGEVVSGATRVWQPRQKDVELETEMLLKFMLYVGGDMTESVQKIKSSNQKQISNISIIESSRGYASAVFPFNKKQSWSYLGWALDELGIDIEDRDKLDGSYYITIPKNKGFISKLLSTSSDFVIYKLIVKETDDSLSQVIISELSGQDEQKTIDFSYEFFEKIASRF
jgi:outer membrane protein assembly factor BamC